VGTPDQCSTAPSTGWYFDQPDSTTWFSKPPSKITLCDLACDQVRSSQVGRVELSFGCVKAIP
jgi:hypothetical protein